jgi:hypothetical protein
MTPFWNTLVSRVECSAVEEIGTGLTIFALQPFHGREKHSIFELVLCRMTKLILTVLEEIRTRGGVHVERNTGRSSLKLVFYYVE